MLQPETLRELKALTIDEIQRSPSVPNDQRGELVNVLTIGLAVGSRLFDCDKLAKLLEERPSADRHRRELSTAIVHEANRQMIFSVFLDFLSQQGETQDNVLKSSGLFDLDKGEQAQFRDPNVIRTRANQLAQCFIEHRSNIIDALVNAIRIWIAGQHKTEIPIPVSGPTADVESKTAGEKKKPRETSPAQLKARQTWLEAYLETKGITKHELAQESELRGRPINHRTIQKILDARPVQENTLVKLARVTAVKRSEIP